MQAGFLNTNQRNTERIVALVDMDCFYVQVEQRLKPEFLGKPCVVVQYNQWQGGGIIAVNYEARAFGIERRGMRGNDAKRKCPDVHLFSVPVERGKANLTRYREAGAQVLEVMCQFSNCVERASIDEAYLDLTEEVNKRLTDDSQDIINPDSLQNTFVVGWEERQNLDETISDVTDHRESGLCDWLKSSCSVNKCDRKLAMAAVIVEEMRAAVYKETTFRCSAGIAHNKMLAKLACGLHKPNRQTILPQQSVPVLFETIAVNKVRNLGGKLGEEVKEKLSILTMGELSRIKENQLTKLFGEKNGGYLFQLAQGIESDPITPRQLPKSIGCGKNIHGNSRRCVQHWVSELSEELSERLIKDQQNNKRVAKHLSISLRSFRASFSKSCALQCYESGKIANDVMQVLQKLNKAPPNSNDWHPILTNISLSASKFQDTLDASANHIKSFFTKSSSSETNAETSGKRLKLDFLDKLKEINDQNLSTPGLARTQQTTDTVAHAQSTKLTGIKGFFAKKMEGMVLESKSSLSCDLDNNSASSEDSCCVVTEIESCGERNIANEESLLGGSANRSTASTSFFNNASLSTEAAYDEFTYKCDQCSKMIPLQDIEEHTDFHYAKKLAKELQCVAPNSAKPPAAVENKNLSLQTKGKKRPKKSETGKKKIQMKPLEYYLK